MKTEPIEARDRLHKFAEMRGWNKNKLIGWSEAADFADWFANQSSPKIKQLDQLGWLEQSNGLIYTPHVFGITYCIHEEKGRWWIHCQFYNNYENISIDSAATLDEAKAAAQADFEKRVKECLE